MNRDAMFVISGASFPGNVDPLGIWQSPGKQTATFSAGTVNEIAQTVWRIHLPGDIKEADRLLQIRMERVGQLELYLDEIATLLEDMDPDDPSRVAYGLGHRNPQQDLMEAIADLRPETVNFVLHLTGKDYSTLYDRCEALINQFRGVVTRRGKVETRIGDHLVGVTKVDWTGDFETIWQNTAESGEYHLHTKAVRLASASRLTVLRLISVVATGALNITIKASIPGGQFLLVPAVYQFVIDMLAELSRQPVGIS
ncbi:MAG: hypothetical protein P1S60_09990 [Anaerolineae bacterium]|nr:hypothetical protein [Anaerolineae bacterium]